MLSHNICLSLSGFFHSVWQSLGSSMLLQMALIRSFLWLNNIPLWGFPGKESSCQCRRCGFDLWVWKVPWRRKWQPTPVFLPGKSHGQRSLAGYSPGVVRVRHDLVPKKQQQQITHCTQALRLLYPFLCQRRLRLLPCPGYCKQRCDEQRSAPIRLAHF